MSLTENILERIEKLEETQHMSDIAVPDLTDNKEINNQLIVYFWWLILLTFTSQLIGYTIQYFSNTISAAVLGILALGSINTLLIGGGVKLVQKQIVSVSDKYNHQIKVSKADTKKIGELFKENEQLKKQMNDRDAEIIQLKVNPTE